MSFESTASTCRTRLLHTPPLQPYSTVNTNTEIVNADGKVGGTAQEVGGPFSADGSVGKQFTKDGAIGGTGQKVAEKAQDKAEEKKPNEATTSHVDRRPPGSNSNSPSPASLSGPLALSISCTMAMALSVLTWHSSSPRCRQSTLHLSASSMNHFLLAPSPATLSLSVGAFVAAAPTSAIHVSVPRMPPQQSSMRVSRSASARPWTSLAGVVEADSATDGRCGGQWDPVQDRGDVEERCNADALVRPVFAERRGLRGACGGGPGM
ncbi:hypothetical protein MRB53_040375 [Persea americana]|nr:hypothetical protein MRB53_040375 [Persea americana]